MSWCGGGEIRPTPGVECRVLAIHGYTLWPGSWPPSPGLAPCAILICRSSAFTRYSLVTPKRPDATCLIAQRRQPRRLLVHHLRVLPEHVVALRARRVLQAEHGLGVEEVVLALAPPLV